MRKKICFESVLRDLFAVMKEKRLSVSETARLIGYNRREIQRWRLRQNYPQNLEKCQRLAAKILEIRIRNK